MPQVGCEIINSLGLEDISLPITNFCKLPPDKLDALTSESGVTTLNLLITLFTCFSILIINYSIIIKLFSGN